MPEYPMQEHALVVDDNPIMCESLARSLTDVGFNAASRHSAQSALDAAQHSPVALAFVDVRLDGADGMALARELRAINPGTEVVFISGVGTSSDLIQAMQIGAFDYLIKPFSPDDLRLTLERYTERRALKRRMERAEQRHTTLLHNIPLLIYRLREDFSLAFINKACSVVLGYDPDEATRHDNWFLSRIRMGDRARVRDVLMRAFASATPLTVECRMAHKSGYNVHGYIKTMPGPAAAGAGEPRLLDGIFVDISERVHMERTALQDEKLKTIGAISDEMAHELRNPLMAIGGFARRLHAKVPDMPETEIILRESRRLENLLDRIRGYLNPVEISAEPLHIPPIVSSCLEHHLPVLEKTGITADIELADMLPRALGDPEAICTILGILLGDASKALAKQGKLSLRTLSTPKSVDIRISYALADIRDIDPERLYLPFEEGGFGLPLCYKLIKNMDGLMRVRRENGNAVFTISLRRT